MSWGHLSSCGEGILSSSGRGVPLSLLLGVLSVMQNRAPLEFRRILMVPLELQQGFGPPLELQQGTRGSSRVGGILRVSLDLWWGLLSICLWLTHL